MARQRIILIIYLVILIGAIFTDLPYQELMVSGLAVAFVGYQIFEFKAIANKRIYGDLILRRQTKKIQPLFIILAIILTLIYVTLESISLSLVLAFWSVVILDILISVMTQRRKPIALAVSGHHILLNDWRNASRDLHELTQLTLNGLADEITMTFANGEKILIRRNEYLDSEIDHLMTICAEKSKQVLSVSDNLRK